MRPLAAVALDGPLSRIVGRQRRGGRDEGLDPQVAAILELQRMLRIPPLESMEPPEARAHAEAGLSVLELPVQPMSRVIDGGVMRFPDDHNELGATTNVQGAIVRDSGGQFLHIEMAATLRRDLLGNATVRANVLATLADAMEGA